MITSTLVNLLAVAVTAVTSVSASQAKLPNPEGFDERVSWTWVDELKEKPLSGIQTPDQPCWLQPFTSSDLAYRCPCSMLTQMVYVPLCLLFSFCEIHTARRYPDTLDTGTLC